MPDGLDHCPFNHPIRHGVRVENIGPYQQRHYLVVCRDCSATGPERESHFMAQEAWNSRRKNGGDGDGG